MGGVDECSNFGVTGHGPPNFWTFNSAADNLDSTVPVLPAIFAFTPGTRTRVQINVGDGVDTGAVTLVALDAGFSVLDSDAEVLGLALQTLSTSAAGTNFAASCRG